MSDEWAPEFPGQRPPFGPGNELSIRSGAYSPRKLEPVAAKLVEEVLSDDATSYLDQAAYAPVLRLWATAQGRAELFGTWLFEQPIEDQITPPRGGSTKSPLDIWLGMVRTATGLADRLGLTPLSRARLGRDVSAAEYMANAGLQRLSEVGGELVAKARARGALTGPEDRVSEEQGITRADTPDGDQGNEQDGDGRDQH